MKFEYRPQKGVPGNCFMAQVFDTENGRAIATINTTADEAKATGDAGLFAAAPELLEALIDMVDGWKYIREVHGDSYGVGWDRAQDKAEKAITKAEGNGTNNP